MIAVMRHKTEHERKRHGGDVDGKTLEWTTDPCAWNDRSTIARCAAPAVVGRYPRAEKCIASAGGEAGMLKDMGWRSLVEEVTIMANQGGRTLLSNISDLKAYLAEWRRESGTSGEVENVDDLIQWKLHSPKALCNICCIGSWLGDIVHTEVSIRNGNKKSIKFKAISNEAYKRLWIALDLPNTENCSSNNCGHILEHMMWLAFESGRYNWILGVVTWCTNADYSNEPLSALGHAEAPPMQSQVNDVAPQESNKRHQSSASCHFTVTRGFVPLHSQNETNKIQE
jgi:hypothetical protein